MDYSMLRVLVVDDARVARLLLIKALKELGVRTVVEASDGAEGMTAL